MLRKVFVNLDVSFFSKISEHTLLFVGSWLLSGHCIIKLIIKYTCGWIQCLQYSLCLSYI